MTHLNAIYDYIDSHQNLFVQRLSDAVAIQSVSSQPEHSDDLVTMINHVADQLGTLQFDVQLKDVGTGLPPVIFAKSPNYNISKQTICVYGHVDVQPAKKEDGWIADPFVLTEIGGKMYGRGTTDDKGPVLGWLHCIEAYQSCGVSLPVNIKFVLEAQEESGSSGMTELILSEKNKFLRDVDYVCISDNFWLGKTKPCLTYGLRGNCYFQCSVEGSTKDLHSGVNGGSVYEAMNDLIAIMGSLTDKDGKILVPGINDNVAPLTEDEIKLYTPIEFDLDEYKSDVGVDTLLHPTKIGTLTHRWRFPCLSLHGIEGAFYEPGTKTVIPRKVIGKFSIRIVPNQTVDEVEQLVISHVKKVFALRRSPNVMTIEMMKSGEPWLADYNHPHYLAGKKAIKAVYGVDPDLTREGGSIPVTLAFQEATEKSVMLLPLGSSDDGAHSQNEKMNRFNYIEGTKLMAAYLHEVSLLETGVVQQAQQQQKQAHHQQQQMRRKR